MKSKMVNCKKEVEIWHWNPPKENQKKKTLTYNHLLDLRSKAKSSKKEDMSIYFALLKESIRKTNQVPVQNKVPNYWQTVLLHLNKNKWVYFRTFPQTVHIQLKHHCRTSSASNLFFKLTKAETGKQNYFRSIFFT